MPEQMPQNWARCDVSAYHSKSGAYADGYRKGWDARGFRQGQVTEAMVQAAANVMNAMWVADPMRPWIDIARAALEAAEEARRG